ncbi:hypothetical protein FIA58_013975 [Flavobacterium jejuense]|uniref:Lipoprotein n=1 Tax=Flavobacterium jejuense TaxID=1544455 RepID=A0ABX0ISJ1_9FLAO|nr:hypothetical protein [Flavobacterium jejuense]NHN26789.1 hypothetical protein [Flavobacterium jejuense]
MKLIKSIFFMSIIGMMVFSSCSTESESTQVESLELQKNSQASKGSDYSIIFLNGEYQITSEPVNAELIEDENYQSISSVVLEQIQGNECSTCRTKCNTIGFYQAPGEDPGVGIWRVKCSNGLQYNVVYGCDHSISIYSANSVVQVPDCGWW